MILQDKFFLIFGPAWLLVSFLAYWPVFFRYIDEGAARHIIPVRYYGAAVFGLLPVLIVFIAGYDPVRVFGLEPGISENPWIWSGGLVIGTLIIVINYFYSGNKLNLENFPQIRNREWTIGLIFHDSLSWVVYLTGYELLFRGLMVFPLVGLIGFWPAAVIGTSLYSLSHYPKSLKEALAAIPFGLLMVFLAWQSQSVWICIFIHVCLAVSNSLFSFHHHPSMKLRIDRGKNPELI